MTQPSNVPPPKGRSCLGCPKRLEAPAPRTNPEMNCFIFYCCAESAPRAVASEPNQSILDRATLATARGTDNVAAIARTPLYIEDSKNRKSYLRRSFYISRSLW